MRGARHFSVYGVVQGVGFRWSVHKTAERLGLTGWVRNRPDGSVEGWAEGDGSRLEALEAWLRDGPPAARVREVVFEDAVPMGLVGFEIRG